MQKVFETPGLLHEMMNHKNTLLNEKNVFTNFIQGQLWANKYKEFYRNTDYVFPIVKYYDGLEARNPLASRAGKQSLAGVYILFACMPPHLIGKMLNIFVCSVFHEKHLAEFGTRACFGKSIEDINTISKEGVLINVNGVKKRAYFPCVLLLGDNKAVNIGLGFSKSFSANHYCRVCKCSKSFFQQLAAEYKKLLRNVKNYTADLLKKFDETGKEEQCILNKMFLFYAVENLSVDHGRIDRSLNFGGGGSPLNVLS